MPEHSLAEFAEKIEEVMPAVMKGLAKRQTNELYKGKITLPQFFILSCLAKNGESKMSELAHVMEVTTAAATGIIGRLVHYGYVARVYDPKDRRVINVRLTHKGLELVEKMSRQRKRVILDVFGALSKEERETYLSILMHIRDVLFDEK